MRALAVFLLALGTAVGEPSSGKFDELDFVAKIRDAHTKLSETKAALEAAVEAEPPVGEEELRHVIERTAAGSVIWAAMPGTVRLEALLLPAPLTPDPTEIRVADSNLGDAGAVRQAARLGRFPQLRVLELPGNRIGAAGMAALNTALEAGACPQLVELLVQRHSRIVGIAQQFHQEAEHTIGCGR